MSNLAEALSRARGALHPTRPGTLAQQPAPRGLTVGRRTVGTEPSHISCYSEAGKKIRQKDRNSHMCFQET